MDFQNSISLGKSVLVEEEIKEKKKINIIENVINKAKSLAHFIKMKFLMKFY